MDLRIYTYGKTMKKQEYNLTVYIYIRIKTVYMYIHIKLEITKKKYETNRKFYLDMKFKIKSYTK